jgi:hypothetical protein
LADAPGSTIIVQVTEHKNPVEQAAEEAIGLARDLFVYAPIGLLFEGPALLPTLIERGKTQVATARVLGKFAADQGQAEIAKQLGKLTEPGGLLSTLGPRPQPARTPSRSTAATSAAATAAPSSPRSTPEAAAALAIPDYDSLSASQVVNRLAGLATDELEAVRSYEGDHRGRKTILNKIAQLQG